MKKQLKSLLITSVTMMLLVFFVISCNTNQNVNSGALNNDAANAVYVAPGEHDEFYGFMSGGFSGQISVYGLPSGRLLKVNQYSHRMPKKDTDTMKKRNRCLILHMALFHGMMLTIRNYHRLMVRLMEGGFL